MIVDIHPRVRLCISARLLLPLVKTTTLRAELLPANGTYRVATIAAEPLDTSNEPIRHFFQSADKLLGSLGVVHFLLARWPEGEERHEEGFSRSEGEELRREASHGWSTVRARLLSSGGAWGDRNMEGEVEHGEGRMGVMVVARILPLGISLRGLPRDVEPGTREDVKGEEVPSARIWWWVVGRSLLLGVGVWRSRS